MDLCEFEASLVYIVLHSEFQDSQGYIVRSCLKKKKRESERKEKKKKKKRLKGRSLVGVRN